jgi:hypothetical protein
VNFMMALTAAIKHNPQPQVYCLCSWFAQVLVLKSGASIR